MSKIGGRIEKLRKMVGLSQERLSKLVGIKRVTLSKIENNERKLTADELIILSKIFNMTLDQLVNPKYEPEIKVIQGKSSIERQDPIRIHIPENNVEKFKTVLLYILNKVVSKPNIGQTVIYKLLYFIDFNYYEKYEEQLIGATYIKNHYGPTPTEFKKIVSHMIADHEIEEIKSDHFNYPQTKYLPLKEADLSELSANEIKMIDSVLSKLSDKNANEISDYSHNDVPWIVTTDQNIIEYETVFYRTPEYSVRDGND
jgi:transcriptional regulator with XRE-family HTH domain